MQQTLILLKPDAVHRRLSGEIIGRFERKGLRLVGLKLVAARTQLTTLEEAAVNAKKAAEERAADEAKLADLNKQGADLEKEKQALRERLEKR